MYKGSVKTVETSGRSKFIAAVMLATYVLAASPASLFAASIADRHRYRKAATEVVERAEALITASDGGRIVLGDASIDIPEGALKEDTVISISRLARVEDTGESLYNAIPGSEGYRFLPAGTKFLKDVTITLPYSAELNSKPQSLEELYTYFYDTERKSWTKLERLEVDEESLKVRSLSNHFTDMINATLTLPESAGPVDVNLNSIKNLEAAKPDGHLIKFNAPNAGPMGDASFSFELGIPSGRRGMQPQVSVSYSSGGGNGIMGRGFDVNYGSAITTDTRNGLPRYDTHDTYMLDGVELEEKERSGDTVTYRPQKESSFSRIMRYGAGSENDWWEVTDKSGTKRIYAQNSSSCVGEGRRTFTWNITKVEDVHGNNVIYEYEKETKEGYVYPYAIWYTGHNGTKGNYCVKFHYDDDGGPARADVRTDARSGEIISCTRLLTGITTHYFGTKQAKGISRQNEKPEESIRSYTFKYKEGLAREKMLTDFTVSNNADEYYSYTFGYEVPKVDDAGNPIFFETPVLWQNGSYISLSGGKSHGGNVNASAGVGFGLEYIDARVTGGVSGSTSSSTGYTRQTLIDIDGDGRCESVAQFGNTLRICSQNEEGTGFEQEYKTVILPVSSFLMSEEKSSSNSYGWNVYGGIGTIYGVLSEGYVYSSVTQDGSNSLYTGFYDMDGDGLVDIVTDGGHYLHNDTKTGGEISFSPRDIIEYPLTYTINLGEKLAEYKKSYAQQRPFSAWVPLYDGIVTAKASSLDNGESKVKVVIGNKEETKSEGLEVGQGNAIYFIPDLGDSPTKEVLEKEMVWENTVEYTQAKAFGRKLEMPVFLPEGTLGKNKCPEELKKLYDTIKDVYGNIISYKLKVDYAEYLDAESADKLMEGGRFIPGVMNEEFFKGLKEHIKKNYSSLKGTEEEFYQRFADAYTYSVTDRLLHRSMDFDTGKKAEEFFNDYIKGYITAENIGQIKDCYKRNGMDADLSGEYPAYRKTVTATNTAVDRYKDGRAVPGTSFMQDEKKLFSLGKVQGGDIIIDLESKKITAPKDFREQVKLLQSSSEDRYVIDIGNGRYTVTYAFSNKKTYTQTVDDDDMDLDYYEDVEMTVDYSRDAFYDVNKGEVNFLIPETSGDTGLVYCQSPLEFPDGRSAFNSKYDFETVNLVDSKKDLLCLYTKTEDEENSSLTIPVTEFLYGGMYGWYYGIWTGSEEEHQFNEDNLNSIFREQVQDDSYKDKSLSKKKIKEKGKSQEDEVRTKVENGEIESTYKFSCTLPKKNGDGSKLEGAVSEYLEETVFDDNGVLGTKNGEKKTSSPYISRGIIRCNRLGGNAYFNIEGIPEAEGTARKALQKTINTGEDVTSGFQISVLSASLPTTTTENNGSAWTVQSLQDVNSDRIPDVLIIKGVECQVYFGSIDSKGNISYPKDPSLVTGDIKKLTENYNTSKSSGFSISPAGAIQTIYKLSGGQKGISLTNGIGGSEFSGTNRTTAAMLDINADGITDHVYYDEDSDSTFVYLGKGGGYENAFEYGWENLSEGHVSGKSGNISFGNGLPVAGNDNSTGQDITGGVSISADVGGSLSVSSSVQDFMLMDMNGDGLADAVRMAKEQNDPDNIIYEVYYNTGSRIETVNPSCIRIPRWTNGDGMNNLDEGMGSLAVNNRAINSNNIIYGKTTVRLEDEADIELKDYMKDIENDMESLDGNVTASVSISGNLGVNANVKIPVWGCFFVNITANAGGGLNSGMTTTCATVKMMDLDGDGMPDHVLEADGKIWWKKNCSGKIGLLNRINLPQGGNIQIDYSEKYGTRDNPSFKYVMSRVTVNDGTDGTGELPKLEHGEHSVTTLYEYDGGYYDRKRKEFYGFRTVRTTFADGTYQVNEYFNREYYSKGVPEETRAYAPKDDPDKEGPILSRSRTTLCKAPLALPEKEESWTYEKASGGGNFIHTAAEYAYDSMGNCTDITQSFDDGTKLSAKIRYEDINPNSYIMGLPVDIKVYGTGGSQLLRHRAGKYDGKGQLVELYQYYDSTSYTTNELAYDGWGNIKSVKDARGATISYEYDDAEHMLPIKISQYGNGTDTYSGAVEYYIDTQTKKSETDCNGNTMKYEYDSWQRISEIFTAYDGETPAVSYEYHTPVEAIDGNRELWYAVTNNKVSFDSSDRKVIQTVVQVDGVGRAVRTAKTGCVDGKDGWNASGAVEYDAKGRTVKEGMTEFIKEKDLTALLNSSPRMTDLYTTYVYDEKDRQTMTVLPDGSEQHAAFEIKNGKAVASSTDFYRENEHSVTVDGRTTVYGADPLKCISVQETDSRGNIVRVAKLDPDGKQLTEVTYTYSEMGEMLNAFDAKGHPVTVEYDMLGRRTALESPDSGRQEFFYDENSNLVRENNSVLRENKKQIEYVYDGLNRLKKIIYPDTDDTVYDYGRASDRNGAAGKIRAIRDASGTLEYEYGKLGEVTKETRVLNTHLSGNKTEKAVMEYCSDYLGRMEWIKYPDGETVTYGYDNGGQVRSVTGQYLTSTIPFNYVTNIKYDQYGQRTYIEYGNGTSTEYKYDPARRWLDTIKTKSDTDKPLQNITYSFDSVGNVLGYKNDCLDSITGNYKTEQSYAYDNLHQLISATGYTEHNPTISPIAPEYISRYTQTFAFDAEGLGNMISKVSSETVSPQMTIGDDLNYSIDYIYDTDNYSHRLVSAGSRYYKYDSNGNVICEQEGKFDGEEPETYHKINKEAENVYSTDYGWGLFRDKSSSRPSSSDKYRRTYTWNERNQLISSVDSNYTTTYVYGQDGQRSNKYTSGSETLYFNSMWIIRTDPGSPGGQAVKNVYLGDTRIVTKFKPVTETTTNWERNNQFYYHSDHLGSASLITDCNGEEYQRIEYTPYGETWVEKTSNKGSEYLPYKFTGKEMDEETGLYYYGARYLDPKYSRWLSTDPALGEYVPLAPVNDEAKKHNQNLPGMGGIYNSVNGNLYHYAGNNPIRYTDPDGRKIFDSNWWRRNRDELIGIGLDSLEIITGIVGLEVTFGVSSLMVIQGSANAGWKIIKIMVTTYIADVDGDEKADYVDSILPESAMGAAFYGLAYLVTKIDGSNYKDEQFCEMMGKIGDLFDMVVGLGLSFKLDKQISNLISQDASMLTNLQKVLKYNKENVIATIGEEGYQLFSSLVLVDNLNNDINDYY